MAQALGMRVSRLNWWMVVRWGCGSYGGLPGYEGRFW